jgi:hypothetical protein
MKSVRGVVLAMLAMTAAPFAMAQEPAGKWTGIVKAPGLDIPLVLVVTKAADGKLSATVESPNQAPGMLMPVDSIALANGELTFAMAEIRGDYKGKWSESAKAFDGTWMQNGTAMELDLARAP